MAEITIATSIAPGNLELQRSAIDTWINLGFKVISLNSKDEIDLLSPEFPGINFETVSRTALDLAGKPYVFFDDILNVLNQCGSEVCGIINSDVHLRANTDFVEYIYKSAATNFLYASRVDIARTADCEGKIYPYGFDVFFFPREFSSEYPLSHFCIGVPWWDYWALLVPIAKGYIVKEIISPIAYHVYHEARWQDNLHELFGNHLIEVARSIDLFHLSHNDLITELLPAYESNNLFLVSLLYLRYFQQLTEAVFFEQDNSLHCFMAKQYIAVRNELVGSKINIYCLSDELSQLRLNVTDLNSVLNSLTSKSDLKENTENSLCHRYRKHIVNQLVKIFNRRVDESEKHDRKS